jgi:ferritin
MKTVTKLSFWFVLLVSLSSPLQAHEAKMKNESMHKQHREMVKHISDYEQQIKDQIQALENKPLDESQKQTLTFLKKVLSHQQSLHQKMLKMHSQMMKMNAEKDLH